MCYRTFRLKGKDDPIPCGKCAECRTAHANAWAFRLMQQLKSKNTESAYFITLTYAEGSVPRNDQGFPTVVKSDLQKFIKRLRRLKGKSGSPVKYYAAAEYGSETQRPHYHIILFNVSISQIEKAWTYDPNRPYTFRRRNRSKRVLHAEISL